MKSSIEEAKKIIERNYKEAMFRKWAGKVQIYWKYTDEDKKDLQEMYVKNPEGVTAALKIQCEDIDNIKALGRSST